MTPFSPKAFIEGLAQELIAQFGRAGMATTPGLVGSARESAVQVKLESLLPACAGVGSGCVIDSYGDTSKQTDIVIFEKPTCPVFSLAPSSGASFYPCEGVIAAGEVKSTLDKATLKDSIAKSVSVKSLRRHYYDQLSWRKYGSSLAMAGVESEKFDQRGKFQDQIYFFILCGKLGVGADSLVSSLVEIASPIEKCLLPNLIISLHDGIFMYLNHSERKVLMSAVGSSGFMHSNHEQGNFQYLLTRLHWMVTHGRTTEVLPFARYITGDKENFPILHFQEWKN